MRCWVGIEHENNGYVGAKTLFVESAIPNIDIVAKLAQQHCVTNIYLGAGEVDVATILGDIVELQDLGFVVLLESSMNNKYLDDLDLSNFNTVIIRSKLFSNLTDNCIIKIRNENDVRLIPYSEFKSNSITDVVDGQYADDIEVYNQ